MRSDQQKYEAITRSRTTVMSRYRKIFQVFEDLKEGLQRAERFYSEMKETVDSISKNVEGFVNNRRAEGAQLLSQIEQNRANSASGHASAERERLQLLMERMSIDPSTASSGGSEARPPPGPSQASFQQSRSSPISPQYSAANLDPRFTIPPQKTPRPVETQPYHQPNPPQNGYQYPPQQPQPMNPALSQSQPPPPQSQHPFSQGAAAPLSEGYHPMAYPYQTSISPHPPPSHQFFPPLSTTPQPGSSYYPQHQSPPQQPSSYQSPQIQYQQHVRFPSNPSGGAAGGSGGGGSYVPPPPPGPPPGSMTSYPLTQGPMPSGPGGYAQAPRQVLGPGQGQGPGKHPPQPQAQHQGQGHGHGQADPWAGLNAWR